MKKIFILFTVLILSGCASLFEGPDCRYTEANLKKVSKSELAAVIGFADGSSEITSENKEILHQVAKKALNEKAKVVVYGHASHRTRTQNILQRIFINLKISNERAVKTAATLISYGVEATDINTLALFDSRPIRVEVDGAAEAANRRAEIYLYWLE
ncbi:MAG: OmpA family protein [Alphaproteobacteria bacterium]|nr:OmpA family protein [Alphaproteobacteria bacterium]